MIQNVNLLAPDEKVIVGVSVVDSNMDMKLRRQEISHLETCWVGPHEHMSFRKCERIYNRIHDIILRSRCDILQ